MALQNETSSPVVDLARFEDEWTKTATSSDEMYNDVPDGTYDAVIEDARVSETVSTGRPVVIWKLRIKGPQAVNRVVTKNRVITENTLAYLKEDLEKCRTQVSRLSELPACLAGLVGRPISLDKRTKDGRANFYFRWASNRTGEISMDDIPF